MYSFNQAAAPNQKEWQYFEMFGNRAIWVDGWKAVTLHANRMPWDVNVVLPFDQDKWELYHVAEDFSESTDLSEQHPEKLAELQAIFEEEAWKYKGIPEYTKNTAGMVWLEPGGFVMGNDNGHKDIATGYYEPFDEEMGQHKVSLVGFWIDQHEVTNAQFEKFVAATGYKTVAEQKPKKKWFPPGFLEDRMIAGSAVFVPPKSISNLRDINQWWQFVGGASWRHPRGPGSDIANIMNHPVVHVAHEEFAGCGLPR